jgi:OOP family OmpA-OmpF porin
MAEVLENIHRGYSAQLDHFNGDTAPFVHVQDELSRCLELQYKAEPQKKGRGYAWAAGGLLVLLFGTWLGWREWQVLRWSQLAETLREQPGLVLTSLAPEHGRFVIRGLRDPLAADPAQFVRAAGLDAAKAEFHWSPYYALDDTIVQQRAVQLLAPPKGVTLRVDHGILKVEGAAPLAWIKNLRNRALVIPGISGLDLSGPNNPEQVALYEAKSEIQSTIIRFPIASATIAPNEVAVIKGMVAKLKDLIATPGGSQTSLVIDIIGHCDSTGAEATNQTLSQRRADRVAAEMQQFGIASRNIRANGVATTEPLRNEDTEENRQYNRSVTFRLEPVSR